MLLNTYPIHILSIGNSYKEEKYAFFAFRHYNSNIHEHVGQVCHRILESAESGPL